MIEKCRTILLENCEYCAFDRLQLICSDGIVPYEFGFLFQMFVWKVFILSILQFSTLKVSANVIVVSWISLIENSVNFFVLKKLMYFYGSTSHFVKLCSLYVQLSIENITRATYSACGASFGQRLLPGDEIRVRLFFMALKSMNDFL